MPTKPEAPPANSDDDRLAQSLVGRGFVTEEELAKCRPGPKDSPGSNGLLDRLVAAGFLTKNQAQRANQESNQPITQRIPGYQLLDKLGQGAMGTVFKARQLSMNRPVAIKVLPARLAANPGFIERFTREAHLAAKLSHNNIVQAIDVGSVNKLHYFVLEYVEGTTIDKDLEKGKVFEEREALNIILQVAQALNHAHSRGMIHRDIKPSNIILTKEGVAKLLDLGLARETADTELAQAEKGKVYGTPYYIAPEQIRGKEDIDGRADIYSLGATLYHMVTGRKPFNAKGVEAMLKAHLHEELTPPDHINTNLSSGLGEVVEFMMAKKRASRYRNCADLILDLECLQAGQPPKLARDRIAASTLETLTEGSEEEEGGDEASIDEGLPPWVTYVLGGLLAMSLLFNLILLLSRK